MKKRQSKLFGLSQGRAVIYFLCHALIICIGISMIVFVSHPNEESRTPSESIESGSISENSDTMQTLLIAIGTGMMATGICGIVTFGWVVYSDNEEEKRKQINDAAEFIGLVNAFDKRSIAISDEYSARIQKARQSIDIIGFGLSALLDDYGDDFETWARHANVRILLIDPDYPNKEYSLADLRDKEERNSSGQIREDVCSFLKKTHCLWSNPNINFNVRLATILPSVNMFRIDNEVFWGPYFVNSSENIERLQSRNLPTFIVNSNGKLYNVLIDHFNAIWNDSDKSVNPREELWKKS